MILQALVQHYEDLLAAGEVVRPGWARAKVSYGLDLSGDGRLLGLLPLQTGAGKEGGDGSPDDGGPHAG